VTTQHQASDPTEVQQLIRPGLLHRDIEDGTALVGSDMHYSPGEPASTAHRGFIWIASRLQPDLIIANGDIIDGGSISKHLRRGWQLRPTMREEIAEAQARLREIEKATYKSQLVWCEGNHDQRYNSWLSNRVPEMEGLLGTRLSDHFSERWQHCTTLEINEDCAVKHNWGASQHAAFNNVMKSGKSCITSHTHRLLVRPYSDWTGIRYGAETGTMANPASSLFAYGDGNPQDWQSGFLLLSWAGGQLMMPEPIPVVYEDARPGFGQIWFRGQVVKV
jgi:predicted phosphodiesterase